MFSDSQDLTDLVPPLFGRTPMRILRPKLPDTNY